MEVLIILTVGAMNIVCLLCGVRIGQAVSKDEKVEMPTISPKKIIQEHKASKKAEMEQDKVNKILQNIDMVGQNLARAQGMCGSSSGSVPTDVGQPLIRVSTITVGGR